MIAAVMVVIAVMVEREQVHEIADGRTVLGHVTVVIAIVLRVRQIVPAPIRDLRNIPVLFDELQQRDVVVVSVVDMTLLRER